MATETTNPLAMKPDPYAGDTFVFPEALCTDERRHWFRRSNEIIGFLMTAELSLKECKSKYELLLSARKLKPDTPIKIESSDGRSVVMPARRLFTQFSDDIEVLCRQVFVMLYGSLETFFFELLERSFRGIGKTENILESSLEIMMGKKWDGKFCKMRDTFGINYKATELIAQFKEFKMDFEGRLFKNPLTFLDELPKFVIELFIHQVSLGKESSFL